MTSITRNLRQSRKNVRWLGLFFVSCILCVWTVLYITDFSRTGSSYSLSSAGNKSEIALVFNRNTTIRPTAVTLQMDKNETKLSLVILVMSAPANKLRRTMIRKTWALKLPKGVKVFFVIGEKNLMYGNKTMLKEERLRSDDLIVLPNLVDNYEKLTEKVVASMKWINDKADFDYLLKTDDDTFVRVNEVIKDLQMKPSERLYWGFFNNGSEIVKVGKWAETKPYICDRYVSYALGGGYVLSKDLVSYIVDNSDKFKMFVNEDVTVGTWLAPFDVNKIHDERFRMYGECKEEHIVLHYSSTYDMYVFNKSLALDKTLCGSQMKRNSDRLISNEKKAKTSLQEGKLAQTRRTKLKNKTKFLSFKNYKGGNEVLTSKTKNNV